MTRQAKIALGVGLAVVVALGIVVTASSGFHGLVIYTFLALLALSTVFLTGFGGSFIKDWSRSRFTDHRRG